MVLLMRINNEIEILMNRYIYRIVPINPVYSLLYLDFVLIFRQSDMYQIPL